MPSAGGFTQQHFFQRVSTSVFVILCLLLVPAATFACLLLGAMICASAGIDDHSTVQNRILWAAVLVGCLGSIFLLVRARRSIHPRSSSQPSYRPLILQCRGQRTRTTRRERWMCPNTKFEARRPLKSINPRLNEGDAQRPELSRRLRYQFMKTKQFPKKTSPQWKSTKIGLAWSIGCSASSYP